MASSARAYRIGCDGLSRSPFPFAEARKSEVGRIKRSAFHRVEPGDVRTTGRRFGSNNSAATYGSYLRVEWSFWDARLGLSRHRARPGRRALNRVENFGTERVFYGEACAVQRLQGEAWVDAGSSRRSSSSSGQRKIVCTN